MDISIEELEGIYPYKKALIKVALILRKSYASNEDRFVDLNSNSSSNIGLDTSQLAFNLSKSFVCKAYGIIGFPKFTEGYYIWLIIKKAKVLSLFNQNIYTIKQCRLEYLLSPKLITFKQSWQTTETDYCNYLNNIDMTNGFYFSFSLDLTRPIQTWICEKDLINTATNANATSGADIIMQIDEIRLSYDDKFVFNAYLLQPLLQKCGIFEFILPIIHGCILKRNIIINNRDLCIGLISKRSRFNYGPRYLRRGINIDGHCANEVVTEQFLYEQDPFNLDHFQISTFLMHRGSIPFYWGHSNLLSPKPQIILNVDKDPNFNSTIKHFVNLINTFGAPIIVLNLIKSEQKNSKEYSLLQYFDSFFQLIKEKPPDVYKELDKIEYFKYDFFSVYNKDQDKLISDLQKFMADNLSKFGIFFYQSVNQKKNHLISKQCGTLRINCIDCLDRTNNAMACLGSYILAKQLKDFDVPIETWVASNDSVKNELLACLFEIYGINGDVIAQQYAGSEAFHKASLITSKSGEWKTKKDSIVMVAIKRYINNTLLDYEKQKVLWLFLGEFTPNIKEPKHLWELDFKEAEKIAQSLQTGKYSLESWKGYYSIRDETDLNARYNPHKYEEIKTVEKVDGNLKKLILSSVNDDNNQDLENDQDKLCMMGRPRSMRKIDKLVKNSYERTINEEEEDLNHFFKEYEGLEKNLYF